MTNPIREEWTSKDGQHRILWGDCLEILPTLDTSEVAAVLADPPYGIAMQVDNANRGRGVRTRPMATERWNWPAKNHAPIAGDDKPFDPSPLLSVGVPSVLWGANNYASKLPDSPCWLAWDKKCGKAAESNLGDGELAAVIGTDRKAIRIIRHMWAGYQRDSEVGESSIHPTQKPVALMIWCLTFLPPGLVLDPFAGSCTVAVACARTGRRSISIEIEEKYFRIGIDRMEREAKRHPLLEQAKLKQLDLI